MVVFVFDLLSELVGSHRLFVCVFGHLEKLGDAWGERDCKRRVFWGGKFCRECEVCRSILADISSIIKTGNFERTSAL
jgi:hypothetical protein